MTQSYWDRKSFQMRDAGEDYCADVIIKTSQSTHLNMDEPGVCENILYNIYDRADLIQYRKLALRYLMTHVNFKYPTSVHDRVPNL